MSNKDYFNSQPHQQQQQQYYPPQGAIFSHVVIAACVADGSVCTQGHRLVKVTTPSSLSSLSRRTRAAIVVSLAISHSHSLKRFMCASEVPTGVLEYQPMLSFVV